ncbi:uncharacterized protein LOC133033584 [Cannabis sativa]|uniref:uncharacterized protein LOC133033584 n=1 Tax=Cannabis sativa TaxID=3483 RepID=UPI0029CA296E|nr:uncharacterized protein LOC133033584 [Cannabis sativa]
MEGGSSSTEEEVYVVVETDDICKDVDRLMRQFWWHTKSLEGQGKQGWRLLTNPTSLVARVFKTRYYSQGSFFDPELGAANPSYVWKSVFEAKTVVKMRARWRVGSGFSIPETVYAILKGGKPSGQGQDKWIWTLESNGQFSCKSAYLSQALDRGPHCVVAPALWNNFWNSKILERHKVIWCCILSNALPVRSIIGRRFQIENSNFPFCGLGEESMEHLFLSCEVVQHLWRASPWGIYPVCDNEIRVWNLIKFIWDLKHKWRTRNELDWIKLNCDVRVGLESMCIAGVARNHLGKVIRVDTSRLDFLDALCGETATCCLAVSMAMDLGYKYIIVESDSRLAINALNGKL